MRVRARVRLASPAATLPQESSVLRIFSLPAIAIVVLALLAAVAVRTAPARVHSAQDDPAVDTIFQGSYVGFLDPLVLGPFRLNAGIVVVLARRQAEKNFVINLRLPESGAPPAVFSIYTYLM